MKKQITIIIGVLVIGGLGFSYGYFSGQNQAEKRTAEFTLLPKSSLIKEWRVGISGEVSSITSESIAVSFDNQSISLAFSQETKVEKIIVVGGKVTDTVKNLSLSDVKAGNKVFVSARADLRGILWADIINLQEIR